jgi:hypothetical protein
MATRVPALFLCIVASAFGAACVRSPQASDEIVGSAGIALELSPGADLSSLGYMITGPGGFSRAGSVDVASSSTATFVVGALPAGSGFQVDMTGVSTNGKTSCAGSATFDVVARATTAVPIQIHCNEGPSAGSVLLGGSINVCPAISALSAMPAMVTVGSQLALSATAYDPDDGPAALTYSWSATSGVLDAPSSPTTRFTCTVAGAETITLVVSDGDATPGCAPSRSVSVQCIAPPPTCSFSSPPPPPGSGPVSSAEDFATASELAEYDSLIGRFLRGDVTIYRGTLSADGAPVYQSQTSIPAGPALALLDIRSTWDGDWYPARPTVTASGSRTAVLLVHSLSSHAYVSYGQDTDEPGVTWSGFIASDDPATGVTDNFLNRSCSGCAPSFWERPSTLIFDGLVTTGSVPVYKNGVYVSVPVSTTSSAHLTAAAPCDLVWQDLEVLDTATGPNEFATDVALGRFQLEGGLMVHHDSGSYVPVPPMYGQCVPATEYLVDLWVDPSDLSNYGVSNFTITAMTMACGI